jgi:hypothetical protein
MLIELVLTYAEAMLPGPPSHHAYVGTGGAPSGHCYGTQHAIPIDPTGQVGPPGAKPRMTATLWEDEGSLCFQVEAKGVCVARREGMVSETQGFRYGRRSFCLTMLL